MAFSVFSLTLQVVYVAVCATLLWKLHATHVREHFPVFGILIGWEVGSGIAGLLVVSFSGFRSSAYGSFYEVTALVGITLLLFSAIEATRVLGFRFGVGTWVLVVATGVILAIDLRIPVNVWDVIRIVRSTALHVTVCFCISISFQLISPRSAIGFFGVGRNLGGILTYLFAASGLQYLLWVSLALGGVGYWFVKWLVQPSVIAVTLAAVVQMAQLDLPQPLIRGMKRFKEA